MKKLTHLVAIALSVALIAGCSSPTGTGSGSTAVTTTTLPFTDDFSNDKSGWETLGSADPVASMAYENGQLRILVKQANVTQWSLARKNLTNAAIEVDATTNLAGPTDNGYGVIFRLKDRKNFYHFEISSDGYWRAGIVKDDKWENWGDWQQHPAIKPGIGVTNRIRVELLGDKFTFSVNGSKVSDKQDATFSEGDFGVFAQSQFNVPGVDISFDNVNVTEAKETAK